MRMPEDFQWIELDTMAECYEGVSQALYAKLWKVLVQKGRKVSDVIDIEESAPTDAIGLNSVGQFWGEFTEDEQRELTAALRTTDALMNRQEG